MRNFVYDHTGIVIWIMGILLVINLIVVAMELIRRNKREQELIATTPAELGFLSSSRFRVIREPTGWRVYGSKTDSYHLRG